MPVLCTRAAASAMGFGFMLGEPFSGTISTNQTDFNLRTWALANGWDGIGPVTATINSGVVVYSTTTGGYAMTISGSFPGGVTLVNNGTILGCGGNGGGGGYGGFFPSPGGAGSAGGPGMVVSTAVTINNGSGRIAGGGGGGAGGSGDAYSDKGGTTYYSGGGGGGGIGNGYGASPNGGNATLTSAGSGGAAPIGVLQVENGQAGGTYGTAGTGATGASGGAAGACLSGNSYITWTATGTRNGTIT